MKRKLCSLLVTAGLLVALGAAPARDSELVFVQGGTFKHRKSNFAGAVTVPSFLIGRHEVTQAQWAEIMGDNPSGFRGERLPVETVTWYDCIEYCNRRSAREGLAPYYTIDRAQKDPANENPTDELKWTVVINPGANGYRLPTELEWEYAAGGGAASRSALYSGGDDADTLAWYWRNSGDEPLSGAWNWPALERNRNRPRPVGEKLPNELGVFDMSGNVREWCWDWYADGVDAETAPRGPARGVARVWKGGGWMGAEFCGEPSFRAGFEPHSRGNDQGFRVCRDAPAGEETARAARITAVTADAR